MANNSRIKFNPVTKEIEVEGTEAFVKTYFGKLQAMISKTPDDSIKAAKAIRGKGGKKKQVTANAQIDQPGEMETISLRPITKRAPVKVTKKKSGKKRITDIDSVVKLVQGSTEGISTAELKEKTGLSDNQIWSIATRAAKAGKIRKIKYGLYGAV